MLLLNMPIVPENKALFVLLYFIFAHFGLYPPFIFIFCNLEKLCLYNREIILAVLLRHNSKTNMTKNGDKLVKSWYFCHIAHP